MSDSTSWTPTHRLLAQHVRLLGKFEDRYRVQFEDGSIGWITGWPYQDVMVPLDVIEREALNA